MSDDTLLQFVSAADPLADRPGSALTMTPEALLQAIRDRLAASPRPRRPSRFLIAALVAVLATATGIAVAAGFNPLAGISAADHPQRADDKLPPAVIAELHSFYGHVGARGKDTLVPASARLVRRLSSGRSVYVVATKGGKLWVLLVEHRKLAVAFGGDPLSQIEMVTDGTVDPDGPRGPIPPLSWGLAKNGVTAVSFIAVGHQQTVPVIHNVWAYEGANSSGKKLIVHYANGQTQTLGHGRSSKRP
jgi:hypothetical protein